MNDVRHRKARGAPGNNGASKMCRNEGQQCSTVCQFADCPGRAISQDLCHLSHLSPGLSRVVRSSQVLSCPVISRPALPCPALLYAMRVPMPTGYDGSPASASYRHPCNFPFPLMLANSKPQSPAVYQHGVHPISRRHTPLAGSEGSLGSPTAFVRASSRC
jgi:hypothetical protein